MNTWKIILATLVIFGAGVVTGGLVVSHALQSNTANSPAANSATPWQAQNRDLLRRMDRELHLTLEQHERIEKIIGESQDRTRSLWKPITPQMTAEMQTVREGIREELKPGQRKKFDELMKARLLRGEAAAREWDRDDHRVRAGHKMPGMDAGTNRVAGTNQNLLSPPVEVELTNLPIVKPEPKRL